MPVLPPAAPRVLPVVPQVTVPVQSNISSESKLYNYTSTLDLGKLSLLSCSNKIINKCTVPCVSCQPSLLSPTADTYVCHVAEPPLSTPRSTIAPVAEPPVVIFPAPPAAESSVVAPSAFDDSNVAVAETPAPPAVAETIASLSSAAEPFVPKSFQSHPYEPDRLDELIQTTVKQFSTSSSWGDFIRSVRGRGDLHPDIANIPHPAAHLLSRFQKVGAPAIMSGELWNEGRIEAALKRGPHSSSKEGIEFLRNEFADMIEKQQWIVLPAEMIKRMFGLRLSPIGLVPQTNRRDRMISDSSYYCVNADTFNIAPSEAMQFGRTLWRLLYRIHHANSQFGPVYMSKVDLSDGFYRLWLRPEDTHRLAVLFPSRKNEPALIGIPLTNPMGWVSSPPNFSACTETVCDMANADLKDVETLQLARNTPHRMVLFRNLVQ